MTPAVSVVIPSRNGAARLPETLAALAAQSASAAFEVVVVDDGSDDGTAEAAARGGARAIRHETARGRGAACNSGVRSAASDVVLLLDDDMTALPGCVEAHRAFHAAHAGAAARGHVALAAPPRDTCFARFLKREEAFEAKHLAAHAADLPFPLSQTGHFSLARRAFLDAGGFDDSITLYGFEDINLGYRLGQRGVRLAYLPEARTIHRAYMTDLDRYLARHYDAGRVARQLALRHLEGDFRAYLRVEPPERPVLTNGNRVDPAGLKALRIANRALLNPTVRRLLGGPAGFALVRAALRAGEAVRMDRAVHFGYHVARDIRYFQGYFDAADTAAGANATGRG